MSWKFLEGLPGNSEIIFTRVMTSKLILPGSDIPTAKPDEIITPYIISNEEEEYTGIESIDWISQWRHRTFGPV